MTGLNKEKRAKRDKIIGPRIRHPSGQVYLDIMFKKEEHINTKLSSEHSTLSEHIRIFYFKGLL